VKNDEAEKTTALNEQRHSKREFSSALDVVAVLLTNILLKNILVILQKHKPVTQYFRSNCNIPAVAHSLSADSSKTGIFHDVASSLSTGRASSGN